METRRAVPSKAGDEANASHALLLELLEILQRFRPAAVHELPLRHGLESAGVVVVPEERERFSLLHCGGILGALGVEKERIG